MRKHKNSSKWERTFGIVLIFLRFSPSVETTNWAFMVCLLNEFVISKICLSFLWHVVKLPFIFSPLLLNCFARVFSQNKRREWKLLNEIKWEGKSINFHFHCHRRGKKYFFEFPLLNHIFTQLFAPNSLLKTPLAWLMVFVWLWGEKSFKEGWFLWKLICYLERYALKISLNHGRFIRWKIFIE